MATLNILFKRKNGMQIDDLLVDIVPSETHTFENEISSYKVEDGYSVTDNVKAKSSPFKSRCMFTNNPFAGGNQKGRDALVLNHLIELAGMPITKGAGLSPILVSKPKKIDVITELYTYVDMYIKSIVATRTPSNSGGLDVDILFYPVRIRQNEFTEANLVVDVKAGKNMKKKMGNNTPTGESSGDTPAKKQSLLRAGFDKYIGERRTPAETNGLTGAAL